MVRMAMIFENRTAVPPIGRPECHWWLVHPCPRSRRRPLTSEPSPSAPQTEPRTLRSGIWIWNLKT